MRFFRHLLFNIREKRPRFSREQFVRAVSLYGQIQRDAAVIEGFQDRNRKNLSVNEADAHYMFDVARLGLNKIERYEVAIDESMRKSIDQRMGGGNMTVPAIKSKFEYIVSAMALPSRED